MDDPPAPSGDGDPSFIDLQEADAALLERCMGDAGFPVSERDGPALGFRVDPEQRSRFETARNRCSEEVRQVIPWPPALDADAIYEAMVEAAECLRAAGFDVSQAPTFARFEAEYHSGPWSAYLDVPPDAWEKATTACPHPIR